MMNVFRIRLSLILLLFYATGFCQTDSIVAKAKFAMQLSEKYLAKQMPIKSHNNLIVMNYLERAYHVRYGANVAQLLASEPVFDDEKMQIAFLKKLYGGKCNCTKAEIMQLNGVAQLMALCINTEIAKPDGKLSDQIWSLSRKEDRDLTHAALGLAWLKEQGKDGVIVHLDSLIKIQVVNLCALAEKEDYSTDTGMEALVALIRLGQSGEIKDEWILKVLAAQNGDGGWSWLRSDNIASHEHSTILAQWILLNYLSNGKVDSKWIN